MRSSARRAAAPLALALACAASPLALACAAPHPSPPQATVRVAPSAGPAAVVAVELARTEAERERGLMGRPRLDPEAGMLFLFEAQERHGFWMKDTLVPLDLLFITDAGRVAAVVERRPLTLDVTDGGVDSRYVLEVNGGWARAHGVRPGDRVRFENVLY
jgi:uncharacterized protein